MKTKSSWVILILSLALIGAIGFIIVTLSRDVQCLTEEDKRLYEEKIDKLQTVIKKQELYAKLLGGTEGGRMIDIDNYTETCIDTYKVVMNNRGIIERGTIFKPGGTISSPMAITTGVKFQGTDLRDFIVTRFPGNASDADVHFRLKLGIYTAQFLDHLQVPANEREDRIGRLGIFIIPYRKSTDELIRRDSIVKGYDLGGLEP